MKTVSGEKQIGLFFTQKGDELKEGLCLENGGSQQVQTGVQVVPAPGHFHPIIGVAPAIWLVMQMNCLGNFPIGRYFKNIR